MPGDHRTPLYGSSILLLSGVGKVERNDQQESTKKVQSIDISY